MNKVSPQIINNQIKHIQSLNNNHNEHQESAIAIQKNNLSSINQNLPKLPITLFTCRICLQQNPPLHANNQEQLQNMLKILEKQSKLQQPQHVITTCRCQGTSGYVHQKCMIQWIDAQYKRSKQKQMKCQICLTQILYDRKTIPFFQINCKNLEDVSACNMACFISVILILAVFIILEIQAQKLSLNDITKITIYVLIAIMIIVLSISMAIIIKQVFYKKRKQTIKVYSNDQIEITGILKDHLTHYDRRSSTHRTQNNIRSVRSIRSARNIRDVQRRNQPNQEEHRNQSSHRQRSARVNSQNRQNQQNQFPRSQRSVRSIRLPQSTRSIQVRSRQQIQDHN